jgi:hypothetical protein
MIAELPLGAAGRYGPIVDLALADGRAYAVLEDDAVVEMSLRQPRNPSVTALVEAAALDIRPRSVSVVDHSVYIAGDGGVVRLSDRRRVFTCRGEAGPVIEVAGRLITAVGRRVIQLDSETYLGSATWIAPLGAMFARPASSIGVSIPEDTLLFVRQSATHATVGLMSPDIRELDTQRFTVEVEGTVRRVRTFGGRVWVVTDQEIFAFAITGDRLGVRRRLPIRDALDLEQVSDNMLAIAGVFGRGLFRLNEDATGPAEAFLSLHREPAGLVNADRDGTWIRASGPTGSWSYRIGAEQAIAEEFRSPIDQPPDSHDSTADRSEQASVSTLLFDAAVPDDGLSIEVRFGGSRGVAGGRTRYEEGIGVRIHCIVHIDGNLWVGHDRGVSVLRIDNADSSAEPSIVCLARVRLAGPVRWLFPLYGGGGAAYVAEAGGFGVIDHPLGGNASRWSEANGRRTTRDRPRVAQREAHPARWNLNESARRSR